MKRISWIVASVVMLGHAPLAAADTARLPESIESPQAVPASLQAGSFRLTTPAGVVVDSDELSGKPYGIFFGFTHCPDVCPTTLAELTVALGQLPKATDFRVYFVSIDPERDTPALMKDYVSNFDPRIVPLGGSRPALDEAIRSFGVVARRSEQAGGYGFAHTASVFLVDGDGIVADRISFQDSPDKAAAKLSALIARTPPTIATRMSN